MASTSSLLKRAVPTPLHLPLRRAAYSLPEFAKRLQGKNDPLAPPRWMLKFVGSDIWAGPRFVTRFQDIAGLQPTEDILDIGCGVGRIALGLINYVEPPGSYEGFDVFKAGIKWADHTITPRHPNFRFQYVDLYNSTYNPKGHLAPDTFSFPYESESFDFTFLISVFTHLLPSTLDQYLAEIARTLRPGGRCLATVFVINDESRPHLRPPENHYDFQYQCDGYVTNDMERPEIAVAYEEADLQGKIGAVGLEAGFADMIRGNWFGMHPDAPEHQDLLLLRKPRT